MPGLKKRVTYRTEYWGPAGSSGRSTRKVFGTPSLVLIDTAGRDLLELRGDLEPAGQCARLFDSIPLRTGLPVQSETKEDLF